MVLQMGVPGGGCISFCILGKNKCFQLLDSLLITDLLGCHL